MINSNLFVVNIEEVFKKIFSLFNLGKCDSKKEYLLEL